MYLIIFDKNDTVYDLEILIGNFQLPQFQLNHNERIKSGGEPIIVIIPTTTPQGIDPLLQ